MNALRAPASWLVLAVGLLLLQLPLILNPGYFSHDELQWAARADGPWGALPWQSWTDTGVFQYRPLTFNLWLLLSHRLFATPYLMHAVFVGLGCVNAVLLGQAIAAAGVRRRVAMGAAAVFTLSPYVAYVHGWVGTLGDLLTLLAALLGLRLLQRTATVASRRERIVATPLVLLVGAALLCKESAVVLPAALLPALYRHPRPRAVLQLIALACMPVVAYLIVRLPVILATPPASAGYAWALGHIPHRLAEYLLFPFLPPLLEVGPTLTKSASRLLAAAACVAALLGALATCGWRWPLVWLALTAVLLAPVLILATSYGQYAYLASAAAVGIAAAAWPRLRRLPRIALGLAAGVAIMHGAAVMTRMRDIGLVQHNFDADLRAVLASGDEVPCFALADEGDRWMAARFVNDVPRYRGVCLAQSGEAAPLRMRRDGHLVRTEP